MNKPESKKIKNQLTIVGSGPAGLTAALYAARGNLNPLVIEGFPAGGQLTLTTDVENYPGFPDGIMGPELMDKFRDQAVRFGAEIVNGEVSKVDFNSKLNLVLDDNTEIETKSVIISTGASAKMLGLKEESLLLGKGVSTCATCDGFFFRDQIVTVVGGGDSAMEEALFLTKFAKKVFIIHRREIFRASQIMLNRAKENPKIEFILNTEIKKINNPDENKVTSAELFNKKTSETTELNTDAVFIAIGHIPNTQIFKNYLELNENGYILTNEGTKTNIPGVFACGDVQDWEYRQAVTAAGSGCMAAIDTERYLSNLK
ncbi:MAG: thioredoxin-disulfide reductase [SAR202 cluster bacterium]|uniref:FAD/NAD(P)-binding domain-containing protein n=1 Tax=marine metagenome TaxID=408172 RepID=A0A382G6A7_9ZZZZ|nr:thioredoxin-disulfide reductase [SAR202 cluster bacterium]|tara:strand:- start:3156 stop:4103 length:948 start_codon:yes stop_codon:yes gene_type:complete